MNEVSNSPEHFLWIAVLKTWADDVMETKSAIKKERLYWEAQSLWTRHLCLLAGVDYGNFLKMLQRAKTAKRARLGNTPWR